jgi:CheY-like chemotaxis protein
MYIPRIVYIDDNQTEPQLITAAADAKGYTVTVECINSWSQLEKYCSHLLKKDENEYPDLLLVGQQLSGYYTPEIVTFIRKNSELCLVPVIVYSHFNDKKIIADCYKAGANSYIQIPGGFDESCAVVQDMIEYWFITNVFSHRHTFYKALAKAG